MNGAEMIMLERVRHQREGGFDAAHDDARNEHGQLADAASTYAGVAAAQVRGASPEEFPADMMMSEGDWPWEEEDWRPAGDPVRNLVKAGALIAAEIDRILRARDAGAV